MSPSQGLYLHTGQHKNRINVHNTDIHALSGIRTHDHSFRESEDSSCLGQHGHRDRYIFTNRIVKQPTRNETCLVFKLKKGCYYFSAQKSGTRGTHKWQIHGPFDIENGEMRQSHFVPPLPFPMHLSLLLTAFRTRSW
jgi:hypothetical protein